MQVETERLGLADPFRLVSDAFERLRPPRRISVSQAAEKHRFLKNPQAYTGKWQNSRAPYLVKPMDRIRSRRWRKVGLFGPPQFGKTEVLLNAVVHAGMEDPIDILLLLPTKGMAQDFSRLRIQEKLLDQNPGVKRQVSDQVGADLVMRKVFRNGATLTVSHPSGIEVSSRPTPLVFLDEFDSMVEDIDGEGRPDEVVANRMITMGANGCVVVTSSFKRTDYSGSIAVFDEGLRELWWWPCLQCGRYWPPGYRWDENSQDYVWTFEHICWPSGASKERAFEDCWLVCPHCDGVVEEDDKFEMNLRGDWVAFGQTINPDGTVVGDAPETMSATSKFCSLASNEVQWGSLAYDLIEAQADQARTNSDAKMKAVCNRFGFPFKPSNGDLQQLDAKALRKRAEASIYRLKFVPAGAVVLLASVDVQKNRFQVLIRAFGPHGESWVVDCYDLFTSPDPDRALDPATYLEDWQTLVPNVLERVYPLEADPTKGLPILSMAVDTGGRAGVTGKAYDFWRGLIRAGVPDKRLLLIKGDKNIDGPAVNMREIDTDARGKKLKYGVRLGILNVRYLKDEVFAGLTRSTPGEGYIHLSPDLPETIFEQVCAEQRKDGIWYHPSAKPNEAWDLLAYTQAAWVRLGGDRIDWRKPPSWIRQVMAMPETDADDVPIPVPSAPSKPDALPVLPPTPAASITIIAPTKAIVRPPIRMPKPSVASIYD